MNDFYSGNTGPFINHVIERSGGKGFCDDSTFFSDKKRGDGDSQNFSEIM